MRDQRGSQDAILAFVFVVAGIACAPSSPENQAKNPAGGGRQAEIRHLIKSNFHFSLECGCLTGDPDTLIAVKSRVARTDIPVLISLLGDSNLKIAGTAADVVAMFGEDALPALRRVADSTDIQASILAGRAINMIESASRRRTPSGTGPQH